MKKLISIIFLQMMLFSSFLLIGNTSQVIPNNNHNTLNILNPWGDIEGHVVNGDGLSLAGVNVGVDGQGQTTTNSQGYYLLPDMPVGDNIVVCFKNGYNTVVDTITVIEDDTVSLNFTLTQPSITISPLIFDETLNPGEYLTSSLSILNTGNGDGNWFATIIFPPSKKVSGSQNVSSSNVMDTSFIDYTQTHVVSVPGGNGVPLSTRSGFDCPDGSVFSNPAFSSNNGYSCEEDQGLMCYQSFSGATGNFTTVTIYAIHTTPPSGQRELLVEIYNAGSTPGSIESSTIVMADPVATGIPVIGYDTYSYTVDIPTCNLSSGWIGVQATSGGSPTFYWLNTYNTPVFTSMQNNSVLPAGLAMCLSSNTPDWLTLDDYDGTVIAGGGNQIVDVNFDASGTVAGEVYTAEIEITTDPDVGTFNIPVTMTIAGDTLYPVYDLGVELVNMITSQVSIHWMIDTLGIYSPYFQYFLVKRDGLAIGTTTEIVFSDWLSVYGTYCYTVIPVYTQGNGGSATNCIEWEMPEFCFTPVSIYNEQWINTQETVSLTIENCGLGMLDFIFPDYVSGSRFACDMEVALYDSWGDGWNGGSLDVFVNGNLVLDDITLVGGGGPEFFSFPVEGGDDISTIYTAGSYSYENSYEFYDGDGNLIYTSADASVPVGVVYGTCSQPSFILDVEPPMGQIPGGQSMDIIITYDAYIFPTGLYDEWLKIETNDPLYQEDSILNQMLVYTPATFYGYVHDCNSGLPMAGVEVTTGLYNATTNAIGYYEMDVDEDIYDVVFNLLGFETVIVVDSFAASGVTTEISICMVETPYPVGWVWATPDEIAGTCMVTWSLPTGPYEIIYDDGEADDFVIWTTTGNTIAVSFTPVGYPATVIGGRFNVGDGSFPLGANFIGTSMGVGVIDDDGVSGMPGTILDSTVVSIDSYGWVDFYGLFNDTILDGDFYIALWQLGYSTNSAPIAVDTDLPTVYRSYLKMGSDPWSISPYQDFMIRAYVDGPNAGVVSSSAGKKVRIPRVTEGPFLATNLPNVRDGVVKDGEIKPVEDIDATRDLVNYTIARVSDFDPNIGPQTGTLTPLANTVNYPYIDMGWGWFPPGFYAYAVKAVYESNESEWVYSNTVPHLLYNTVTVVVYSCNDSVENSEVYLYGTQYPYDLHHGFTNTVGIVVFDSVIDGNYDLFVSGIGYHLYEQYNYGIYGDITIGVEILQKMYPPTNLEVDPLTSVATWNEPFITQLYLEDFEDPTFPPSGWQATTIDAGWFRSDDASSGGWTIPPGDGFYAVTNDDSYGSTSSGEDYLITPMVDLRESEDYALYFSQFYDGAYGFLASVEYSYDNGANWNFLETMTPLSQWTDVVVDLSQLSGIGMPPVWLAFHGDDQNIWSSGWAVDNVEVKNGPAPVLAYYVFLDNVFEAQTGWNETTYTFPNLIYGIPYEACVLAVYDCGASEPSCTNWESIFLQAPRNLSDTYLYGTNEVPLMWNPPMTDVTGKSADFSIVYEGPNQSPFNNNSDVADSVTIIDYVVESGRNMGDLQFSFPNAGTGEAGCETDGEFIYTAQWNGDSYFKYDLAGNLLETFTIPGTSGVRDMAWDGDFFYGAAANSTVFVMDFTTHTLVTSFTAPTDVRAIAFNHLDNTFYANNWGTDIICFDVNGTNLGFFTPGVSAIYGLAFDNWSGATTDKYLWAYDQGENNLSQYLLPLGTPTGLTIDVPQIIGSNELAGGLFTHMALYDDYEVTLGGNAQNDIVWALEIAAYSGGPTGTIPDGLASFNLYCDGVNIANIPYDGQGVEDWITYIDNGLVPNPYIYNVTAIYDLDIFGFPGETAESAMEGPDSVNVVWGSIIPFVENWDNGTFTFHNWTFNENSANWVINSQQGEPEPAAEFTWDPLLENDYSATLTSYPIIVDYITEGDLFLTFDLKLVDRNSTGNEKMLIEIYDGTIWHLAAEFSNSGKFGFSNNVLNITQYATGNAINIRFNASGQNSFDIISWFVDNISVYRECIAPTDLTGEPLWDPSTNEPYIEICWDAQDIPVSIINNTLVIEKINEIPTVDSNTHYRSITGFNVYRKVMNETEYELYDVVDFIDGQTYYCYNDEYPNINLYNGYYYQVTASYTSETDMCESSPAMALEIPYDDYVLVYFEGVDDNSIIQHIAVYPNPAKENVNISSTLPIKNITVTNYVGQIIHSEKVSEINNFKLNTSSYKQGIYLISVDTENGTTTNKMIINR